MDIKLIIQESIWAMQTAHDVGTVDLTNSINRLQDTLNKLNQLPDIGLVIQELAGIVGKYENRDVLLDAKQITKTLSWKHDASFNPQFLGAQPARAGQDY